MILKKRMGLQSKLGHRQQWQESQVKMEFVKPLQEKKQSELLLKLKQVESNKLKNMIGSSQKMWSYRQVEPQGLQFESLQELEQALELLLLLVLGLELDIELDWYVLMDKFVHLYMRRFQQLVHYLIGDHAIICHWDQFQQEYSNLDLDSNHHCFQKYLLGHHFHGYLHYKSHLQQQVLNLQIFDDLHWNHHFLNSFQFLLQGHNQQDQRQQE